jgi:16S rRNA processing protein RimM
LIFIGEILKPQGIKGEVKLKPYIDNLEKFKSLRSVFIDGRQYSVTGKRIQGGYVFMIFEGVPDRNAAEFLRGKKLGVPDAGVLSLSEGEYFISDLIGCEILSETGEPLGNITDVRSFGAAPVIEAVNGVKTLRFPFLNKLVKEVNVAGKRFIVYKERWREVTVFDD